MCDTITFKATLAPAVLISCRFAVVNCAILVLRRTGDAYARLVGREFAVIVAAYVFTAGDEVVLRAIVGVYAVVSVLEVLLSSLMLVLSSVLDS